MSTVEQAPPGISKFEARGFAVGAFLCAGIAVYGLLGVSRVHDFGTHRVDLPFDRELWSKQDWADSCTPERHFQSIRAVQVEDVCANHLHAGMSLDQLRELLGRPDSVDRSDTGAAPEWVYLLETDEMRNPLVTLRIAFDAQDRVVSSRILDQTFQYK